MSILRLVEVKTPGSKNQWRISRKINVELGRPHLDGWFVDWRLFASHFWTKSFSSPFARLGLIPMPYQQRNEESFERIEAWHFSCSWRMHKVHSSNVWLFINIVCFRLRTFVGISHSKLNCNSYLTIGWCTAKNYSLKAEILVHHQLTFIWNGLLKLGKAFPSRQLSILLSHGKHLI